MISIMDVNNRIKKTNNNMAKLLTNVVDIDHYRKLNSVLYDDDDD